MSLGIALLSGGCVNDDEPDIRSLVAVGDRLPQFEVVMNDGRTVATADLAGSKAVVVLFTTSCYDCRNYLPVVESLHRERPALPIICIARSEDASALKAYWKANGLTVDYSAQTDAAVYSLFATGGVPRTYISDASLTVIAEWDDSPVPTIGQLLDATAE